MARHFGTFDCLQASADPDACKVSCVYSSVLESYRRLLAPEAFCIAAGVDPWRVLELIAAREGRDRIVRTTLHPVVVHIVNQKVQGNRRFLVLRLLKCPVCDEMLP